MNQGNAPQPSDSSDNGAGTANRQSSSSANDPDRVVDAIAYLDNVKKTFRHRSEVYTRFLDIMKDFKHHIIDTPGVILRVSQLFHGYPQLIMGFNTFLPTGFDVKIEGQRILIHDARDELQIIKNGQLVPREALSEEISIMHQERIQLQQQDTVRHGPMLVAPDMNIPPYDETDNVHYECEEVMEEAHMVNEHEEPVRPQTNGIGHVQVSTLEESVSAGGRDSEATVSAWVQNSSEMTPQRRLFFENMLQNNTDDMMNMDRREFSQLLALYQSHANRNTSHCDDSLESSDDGDDEDPDGSVDSTDLFETSEPLKEATLDAFSMVPQEVEAPVDPKLIISNDNAIPDSDQNIEMIRATGFVERIKYRFEECPDVYRSFIELIKVHNGGQSLKVDSSVLESVIELFGDDNELIEEFRAFLPYVRGRLQRNIASCDGGSDDESCVSSLSMLSTSYTSSEADDNEREVNEADVPTEPAVADDIQHGDPVQNGNIEPKVEDQAQDNKEQVKDSSQRKRKYDNKDNDKYLKDPRLAVDELIETVPVEHLSFFHRVRGHLTMQNYEDFVRFISLYTHNIITGQELVNKIQPFIGFHKGLMNGFRDLVDFHIDDDGTVKSQVAKQQETETEVQNAIDYASCKQLGVSYRSLPDTHKIRRASGRTALCDSVLNDTWVSFPLWASEETSVAGSKKSQFEEFLYRTEDERYELDMCIVNNRDAMAVLEGVTRKMGRMSTHEQEKFRLDERLGGTSMFHVPKAIRRIYGENAIKIVEGLKRNPLLTIPKVLERLREKDVEWTEAKSAMNGVWREQLDKYIIRCMDYQSQQHKQNDTKCLKAKYFLDQIDQQVKERRKKRERGELISGPHQTIEYPSDRSIIHDAASLVIHYVKRQSNVNKEEKRKMKLILRRFVPDWLWVGEEATSDDEPDERDSLTRNMWTCSSHRNMLGGSCESLCQSRLLMGGNAMYLFIRCHQMLCERLGKVKTKWKQQLDEYEFEKAYSEEQAKIYEKFGKTPTALEMTASDACNGLAKIKAPVRTPVSNYPDTLEETKRLLDGIIDQNSYEETLRWMFPTDGYVLFTVDKLIPLISRQLQSLVADSDNCPTLHLYQKFRSLCVFPLADSTDKRKSMEQDYEASLERASGAKKRMYRIHTVDEADAPLVTIEMLDNEEPDDTEDDARGSPGEEMMMDKAESIVNTSDEEHDTTPRHHQRRSNGRGPGHGRKGRWEGRTPSRDTREPTVDSHMDVDSPTVSCTDVSNEAIAGPSKSTDSEGSQTDRVFMRRNLRHVAWPLEKSFMSSEMTMVVSADGDSRPKRGSSQVLIKKRRNNPPTVTANLERMHSIRMNRAGAVWKKDLDGSGAKPKWMTDGMVPTRYSHPLWSYIHYTVYRVDS